MNLPLIKARLAELELSQYDLAERLGVPRSTVANWLVNRADPSTKTLRQLAKILQVTADDLLADSEAVATFP